ncbi:kinesin-like protein KIF19 isoform X2 [Tachypleus tridentatus]|uniref:kinesin-like protein KIF19 isoform X2 n=1 Tax=Tachypleus tridentatus TaxID=6853 RepID=UPI003FD21C7A
MAGKQKSTDGQQQLMVALRIRPIFANEANRGPGVVVRAVAGKIVILQDPQARNTADVLRAKRSREKRFVFDWAFDGKSKQEEVYIKTTKKLVENVMKGYNATVFAYGATGAGKTHTMVGTDEDPGIMVRALSDLFKEVRNNSDATSYEVKMSYLEVYNENIRDLLNSHSGQLDLREDSQGNHQVIGLSEVSVSNEDEVMKILTKGNKNRTQEATGANKTSSRSHAMLQVHVKQSDRLRNTVQKVRTGTLYMVDLAGSERASHTNNTGQRFKEGAHINMSLLALGNCINALAVRGVKYVNFRDSKLTRLLKEPLNGNCQTLMIAHVSPAAIHFDESRNTLVYADRAKNITNKVRNNVEDVSHHIDQYENIISELRQEIQKLQEKVLEQVKIRPIISGNPDETKMSDEEMKKLRDDIIVSFNRQMEVRKKIMEIDNKLLELTTEFGKLAITLNEWETEKAKSDAEKDKETSDGEEVEEPQYVRQAWDDIEFVISEQHRYLSLREETEKEYDSCCEKTYKLAETFPQRANSEEQKELLDLLMRVHELEIEKMEMQADQILREHELRQRDILLARFDKQRQLCDEIITKQRAMIDSMDNGEEKNMKPSRELQELYRIYSRELDDLASGRESVTNQFSNIDHRTQWKARPPGTTDSLLNAKNIERESRRNSLQLPPISSAPEDLFLKRSRSPNISNARSDSYLSIRSYLSSEPSSPSYYLKFPAITKGNASSTRASHDHIVASTRNISNLAAKRRSARGNDRDMLALDEYFSRRRSCSSTESSPPETRYGRSRSSSFSCGKEVNW